MSTRAEWQKWRRVRDAELATPHGWLTPVGFSWLPDEPSTVDGLPGEWWTDGVDAHVRAAAADDLATADGLVDGTLSAFVAEAGSLDWVTSDERLVELVRRGGRYAVRVRDPRASTRASFTGVPTYDYDPAWVRTGTYHEYATSREVSVATARDDLVQTAVLVGEIELDLGTGARWYAASAAPGVGLAVLFHDPTNESDTSPWRVVRTSVPAPDGRVVVDFNRATNLPFAFTAYGTCPAPVPGNRLDVPVTAGEKRPA